MATTSAILTIVRAKLLETGVEILSDATLLQYLNFAYEDLYKQLYTNSSITTGTATFSAGSFTLPSTVGTLYGAPFDSANNQFEEVSIEDFYARILDRMVTIESGAMKVYPTATATLTYKYYPKPVTLDLVSVNPTVDSYFHEVLVYGTMARALEDLQDEELSTFYANKFDNMLKSKKEIVSQYEETNQTGAQMFSPQVLITDDFNAGLI